MKDQLTASYRLLRYIISHNPPPRFENTEQQVQDSMRFSQLIAEVELKQRTNLTGNLLSANGFKYKSTRNDYIFNQHNKRVIYCRKDTPQKWNVSICHLNDEGDFSSIQIYVKTVSELEDAMRIVGINKVIELNKQTI